MSVYIYEDIKTSFEGDILLNSNGDLAIATSLETQKSAANFLLRTDYGDYQPNGLVGANLGSYIGEINKQEIHEQMEHSCSYSLQKIFSSEDFVVSVVPFDLNEAICVVNLAGIYLVDNEYQRFDKERIVYSFPFIEAKPTPLTI